MKTSTVLIILLILVVLMVHKPSQTTAQITDGEDALVKVTGAAAQGLFGAPTKAK